MSRKATTARKAAARRNAWAKESYSASARWGATDPKRWETGKRNNKKTRLAREGRLARQATARRSTKESQDKQAKHGATGPTSCVPVKKNDWDRLAKRKATARSTSTKQSITKSEKRGTPVPTSRASVNKCHQKYQSRNRCPRPFGWSGAPVHSKLQRRKQKKANTNFNFGSLPKQ